MERHSSSVLNWAISGQQNQNADGFHIRKVKFQMNIARHRMHFQERVISDSKGSLFPIQQKNKFFM
jgi:hypothetical protein